MSNPRLRPTHSARRTPAETEQDRFASIQGKKVLKNFIWPLFIDCCKAGEGTRLQPKPPFDTRKEILSGWNSQNMSI